MNDKTIYPRERDLYRERDALRAEVSAYQNQLDYVDKELRRALDERDELRETVEHYRQLEDVFEAKDAECDELRAGNEWLRAAVHVPCAWDDLHKENVRLQESERAAVAGVLHRDRQLHELRVELDEEISNSASLRSENEQLKAGHHDHGTCPFCAIADQAHHMEEDELRALAVKQDAALTIAAHDLAVCQTERDELRAHQEATLKQLVKSRQEVNELRAEVERLRAALDWIWNQSEDLAAAQWTARDALARTKE